MIKYWAKMNIAHTEKLSLRMYKLCRQSLKNITWCQKIKEILYMCGFYEIWDNDILVNPEWIAASVKQKLRDLYLLEWRQLVNNSSKCYLYRVFKNDIILERYLLILNWNLRKHLCKLRTVNHKLPIETGRYKNVPRQDRHCTLCRESLLGDEFHIIFRCAKLRGLRNRYLPRFVCSNPNISVLKLEEVFQCSDSQIVNLALFAKHSLSLFS